MKDLTQKSSENKAEENLLKMTAKFGSLQLIDQERILSLLNQLPVYSDKEERRQKWYLKTVLDAWKIAFKDLGRKIPWEYLEISWRGDKYFENSISTRFDDEELYGLIPYFCIAYVIPTGPNQPDFWWSIVFLLCNDWKVLSYVRQGEYLSEDEIIDKYHFNEDTEYTWQTAYDFIQELARKHNSIPEFGNN